MPVRIKGRKKGRHLPGKLRLPPGIPLSGKRGILEQIVPFLFIHRKQRAGDQILLRRVQIQGKTRLGRKKTFRIKILCFYPEMSGKHRQHVPHEGGKLRRRDIQSVLPVTVHKQKKFPDLLPPFPADAEDLSVRPEIHPLPPGQHGQLFQPDQRAVSFGRDLKRPFGFSVLHSPFPIRSLLPERNAAHTFQKAVRQLRAHHQLFFINRGQIISHIAASLQQRKSQKIHQRPVFRRERLRMMIKSELLSVAHPSASRHRVHEISQILHHIQPPASDPEGHLQAFPIKRKRRLQTHRSQNLPLRQIRPIPLYELLQQQLEPEGGAPAFRPHGRKGSGGRGRPAGRFSPPGRRAGISCSSGCGGIRRDPIPGQSFFRSPVLASFFQIIQQDGHTMLAHPVIGIKSRAFALILQDLPVVLVDLDLYLIQLLSAPAYRSVQLHHVEAVFLLFLPGKPPDPAPLLQLLSPRKGHAVTFPADIRSV